MVFVIISGVMGSGGVVTVVSQMEIYQARLLRMHLCLVLMLQSGLEFDKSQRAVENREKWGKLVAKSSVVPQRPSRLRDR